MNARRERDILEGIGNNLIHSACLVFQKLENVQSIEDELRDARRASERLAHEKDQVATALEFEKVKVVYLTQERSSALEEKQLALEEKRKSNEEKRKSDEEKLKALEERRLALEETESVKTLNSALQKNFL